MVKTLKNRGLSLLLSLVLILSTFTSGILSMNVFASKTTWSDYGSWSNWQDTAVSKNDYRDVDTQQVDDQPIYTTRYSYKTVYHYYRYATSRTGGSSSYGYQASGTNYYQIDSDTELEYAGNYGGYIAYKWWYSDSHWRGVFKCDPFTTQEVASSWQELTGYTKKTQYRYRTRTKTDSYYVTYNANGGTNAPATQTKTNVSSVNGTTYNNVTITSDVPTKTYTITYNANGGSVSPTNKSVNCTFKNWNTNSAGTGTTYTKGNNYSSNADLTLYAQWTNPTAGALTTPTRTGHIFNGWFTSTSGGTQVTSSTTVTGNTTIYAHWTPETYTISYNANGGSNAPENQTKTYGVTLTLSSSKPERKGYIFKGWGESADDDVKFKSGASFTKESPTTLYAVWQAEKYSVSFDANGGTGAPDALTYEYDKYVTISKTAPTKTYTITYNTNGGSVNSTAKTANCAFTGWNTLQDGSGKKYDLGGAYTSDSDATLYAQWTNPTAGTLATPTRTGYNYSGWYSALTGGTQITSSTTIAGNTTAYARWSANQYNVVFDPNGGQCETTGISVTYDKTYGQLPTPTRSGYNFSGWYTETSGGTNIVSGSVVKITNKQTLYARWTAKEYTLTFDCCGGQCSVQTQKVTHDSKFGTLPTPTRTGYKFVGWFDNAQGGVLIQSTDTVTRDIGKLYAHWSLLETYVINYDANGGTNAPSAQVKTEATDIKLTTDKPNKTIHIEFDVNGGAANETSKELTCTFNSWNTSRNGTGRTYRPGDIYSNESAATLYAQWSGAKLSQLPVVQRTGYTFSGWYSVEEKKLTTETVLSINETFKAKWTANEYAVEFFDGRESLGVKVFEYDKGGKLSYGIMPEKEGFNFVGWSSTDGEAADYSYNQEVSNLSNEKDAVVKLYAVWHKLLSIDELTYSFGNTRASFNYANNYQIPLSSYIFIFGNNTRAKTLYYNDAKVNQRLWAGNCFGMSSTSSMFNSPTVDTSIRDYNPSATLVSDLKTEDHDAKTSITLLTYLEGMQLSQKCNLIQTDYRANQDKLNDICQTIEAAKFVDQLPVLALFGNEGGHAVVGYKIEKISDTKSYLYIYDCNFPQTIRYITLSTDKNGNYTGWYYKINDRYDWGTDYSGSWISYVPYMHIEHVWKNHGDITKMETVEMNILSINSPNFEVRNKEGRLIGRTIDGKFTSFDSRVFEVLMTEVSDTGFSNLDIMLPSEQYTIVNHDTEAKTLKVSMVDVDLGATVSTTAKEVTVSVQDQSDTNSIGIVAERDSTFEMSVISSANNGYNEVVLSGVANNSEITLSENKGKLEYNTNGGSNLKLTVDGKNINLDQEKPVEIKHDGCKYCGKDHSGFFGKIIQFFHNILYFLKHMFR